MEARNFLCGTALFCGHAGLRHPQCLVTTIEADVRAKAEDEVKGLRRAWLPATRLVGPQQWWACQRPAPQPALANVREPPVPREVRRLLDSDKAGTKAFKGAVRAAIEKWALCGVETDDLPLVVCQMSASSRDLVRLIVRTSNFQPAQSAAAITDGEWTAHLYGDRVILRP